MPDTIPERTIAAMRELAVAPNRWLIAKWYTRNELRPAITAGLIDEKPKISPGGFRFVYQITRRGIDWLKARDA